MGGSQPDDALENWETLRKQGNRLLLRNRLNHSVVEQHVKYYYDTDEIAGAEEAFARRKNNYSSAAHVVRVLRYWNEKEGGMGCGGSCSQLVVVDGLQGTLQLLGKVDERRLLNLLQQMLEGYSNIVRVEQRLDFGVDQRMVGLSAKDQARVWFNQDFSENQPSLPQLQKGVDLEDALTQSILKMAFAHEDGTRLRDRLKAKLQGQTPLRLLKTRQRVLQFSQTKALPLANLPKEVVMPVQIFQPSKAQPFVRSSYRKSRPETIVQEQPLQGPMRLVYKTIPGKPPGNGVLIRDLSQMQTTQMPTKLLRPASGYSTPSFAFAENAPPRQKQNVVATTPFKLRAQSHHLRESAGTPLSRGRTVLGLSIPRIRVQSSHFK